MMKNLKAGLVLLAGDSECRELIKTLIGYSDDKAMLKEAVNLLRDWRNHRKNEGDSLFTLTTATINFLDKYDKGV